MGIKTRLEIYKAAMECAKDDYMRAAGDIIEEYNQARLALKRAFEDKVAPFDKAYQEAVALAEKNFDESVDSED